MGDYFTNKQENHQDRLKIFYHLLYSNVCSFTTGKLHQDLHYQIVGDPHAQDRPEIMASLHKGTPNIKKKKNIKQSTMSVSVVDPDMKPYVFRAGSFHQQAKKVGKTFVSTIVFCDIF
jgi:hypothetical protein